MVMLHLQIKNCKLISTKYHFKSIRSSLALLIHKTHLNYVTSFVRTRSYVLCLDFRIYGRVHNVFGALELVSFLAKFIASSLELDKEWPMGFFKKL